jgi:hypothetical protein
MHFVGKASLIYIVHHDVLYMILWASLVCYGQFWLSSWWSWFMLMVDSYVFEKWDMYALLWVNAFIGSWHVFVVWLCLICGWIVYLIIWGQRLICHHECLALMLYLVEGHKFLFVAKTFHVPYANLKMNANCLENVLPCHLCLFYISLGAKSLHVAYQWEVSYV